jgi:hypothetical protein
MSLTGWPRWMLLAAAMAITATFLALPAVRLETRPHQQRGPRPAMTAAAALLLTPSTAARGCVTPRGMCAIGRVRAGDPCSCPDSLHGSMPGHVELVGGPLAHGHSRDWPSVAAEDPLLRP